MELYQFGAQTRPTARSRETTSFSPAPVLHAQAIKVLWSSWCDVVLARQDALGSWTLDYMGSGLTSSQSECLTRENNLIRAVSINTSSVRFFGGAMHEGLRGYVISNNGHEAIADSIVLFATDQEIDAGIPEVQYLTVNSKYEVLEIQISSRGSVLVSMRDNSVDHEQILRFQDLAEFRRCLTSEDALGSIDAPLAFFRPVQWCVNATTSTILDSGERVSTSTSDPRFPRCLGRPYEGSLTFDSVPYLSETQIVKIASGGYMSAALSSDGELFLWGQACPGATEELKVLKEGTGWEDGYQPRETRIETEGEQDELVKCLTVRIDGEEARVYAVAIGHGHILVAAESLDADKKVLFVAGDNSRGQSGTSSQMQYFNDFTEVPEFRGKRIKQLAAAGWSSSVVVST